MSQPTPYNRQTSFTTIQQEAPTDPLPGSDLDAELNAVKQTLDETLQNLALIQRDDGEIANKSVGLDQLKSEVEIGFASPTLWATATHYKTFNAVFFGARFYRCLVEHTSTDFTADLLAGKWEETADFTQLGSYFQAASATSQTIELGTKSFAIESDRFFGVNDYVVVTHDADNYMIGRVTAYTGTNLTLDVVGFAGAGTFASWTIRLSGALGTSDLLGDPVLGPTSSTDNNFVIFDGVTGHVLKDGGKAIPSGAVVGDSDAQTLTNKTLTSPAIDTPTISGGTINNAPIGGTTPAAGSFTTLDASGDATVGGDLTVTGTITGDLTGTVTGDVTGNLTGSVAGDVTGNADTATKLATARNIDGRPFDGTEDITVVAPATHAATSKTAPDDADEFPIADSAASFGLKKLTWANLLAAIPAAGGSGGLSVTANGLANDAKVVSDGVSTASSTTFTSASAAFTSDDVGKTICILGAGVSSTLLLTTIASVTNSTTIELTDSASSAGTGLKFIYGTDNTSALNSLISNAGSGAFLWFPQGDYLFTGSVVVDDSAITFAGEGMERARLWYANSGSGLFFDIQDKSQTSFRDLFFQGFNPDWSGYLVTVRNTGTADPAGTNFRNCWFSQPVGGSGSGMNLDTSIMNYLDNCQFSGGLDGIRGQASSGSSYSNVFHMRGGEFINQSGFSVRNAGQSWSFDGVNFEAGSDGMARAFANNNNTTIRAISFNGCWFGDVTVTGGTQLTIVNCLGLSVRGCFIAGFGTTGTNRGISLNNVKGFAIEGNNFVSLSSAIDYTTASDAGIVSGNISSVAAFQTTTTNRGSSVVVSGNVNV